MYGLSRNAMLTCVQALFFVKLVSSSRSKALVNVQADFFYLNFPFWIGW